MKQKKAFAGVGDWKGFIRMLGRIDLPWLLILIAFVVEMTYNHFLLALPATTGELLSGNLEDSAIRDALIFYISYGVICTVSMAVRGAVCRLAVRNARTRIWGSMTRVRMEYYDSHTPAALTSTVTNDLEESVRQVTNMMITLLPSLYYLGGAVLTIADYDPLLVISVLLTLPLRYLEMVFIGRWNYRTQSSIYQRISVLTGYLAERVKNLPLIRHYGTEEQELENGKAASANLFKAKMQAARVESAATGVTAMNSVIQQVVVVLFGVILLQKGRIDISQWVAFFMFSSTISGHIVTLVQNWQLLKSAQGQAARAVELLEAPVEQTEQEAKAAASLTAGSGSSPEIRFENVSFAYGDKSALRNVSFSVPAGTATAIVGLCGSGKTTLLNLLERFYEVDEGRITLDGEDISTLTLARLRSHFSYVQQDAGVFSGTVQEALSYGINREISDEELLSAARSAGALDFVKAMPGGLDAPLAADGQSLSGGQRQRLVLAREFLRGADVLLLDEPTSALDADAARAVEETIFRMFRGRTILMVTHDMSLLGKMDQIVVLKDGELVGQGSCESLLKTCPVFREMVSARQREEAAR